MLDPLTTQTIQTSSGTIPPELTQLIEKIQSLLPIILTFGLIVSFTFFIYIIAATVHKWRVESAILRIDKNLQKLVAAEASNTIKQIETTNPDTIKITSEEKQIEQK